MSSSVIKTTFPTVLRVEVTEDSLFAALADGRSVTVPLAWFPRLLHATPAERNHWQLIGVGQGIHWPDLDEDISVENLLTGQPSGESPTSLSKWLSARTTVWPGENYST